MHRKQNIITQKPRWKRELASAYRQPNALLADLQLSPKAFALSTAKTFPFLVPKSYAALMNAGDPADPLLLQILPRAEEAVCAPGDRKDPVGDLAARRAPGLLQKYAGRALLLLTGACALHCRYCFRRHFPYGEETLIHDLQDQAIQQIAADPGLSEIILSGGDPLLYEDQALSALLERLGQIPHVRRIRIHSRLPIALPARITEAFADQLAEAPLPVVLVIHANHPQEIGEAAREAIERLVRRGIPVFNQSVLLRQVNDRVEVLAALSERLFENRVIPYYLHLLDPVQGAAHFQVPEHRAKALMKGLLSRLPGYLVPRMVREQPGLRYKQPIC